MLEGALFQPGVNQIPGACQVHDLARAELIIANADDAVSVRALRSMTLSGRVLLLGASDAGTGWPVVSRPLRLHAVLEAARRMLAPPPQAQQEEREPVARPGGWLRRHHAEPTGFAATQPFMPSDAAEGGDFVSTRQFAAPPTPQKSAPQFTAKPPVAPAHRPERERETGFAATQPFTGGVPSVAPSGWEQEQEQEDLDLRQAVQAIAARAKPPVSVEAPPAAPVAVAPAVVVPTQVPPPRADAVAEPAAVPASPAPVDRILVVGHSGTAADGLLRILKSAGFAVDFVPGERTALAHLAQQPYGFVFLIEVSLGPKVIALCQAVNANRGVSSQDMRLVIVASHRGLWSRMRAWFAGCNDWMAIPLHKKALVQYLGAHGSQEVAPN